MRNYKNISINIMAAILLVIMPISAYSASLSLSEAAKIGDTEATRTLIDQGADINEKGRFGYTPLMWAIEGGHTALAVLLINKGADVSVKASGGWTPLFFAVNRGQGKIAQLLLDKGADANCVLDVGWTCLSAATGRSDIIKLLLSRNADVDLAISGIESMGAKGKLIDREDAQKRIEILVKAKEEYLQAAINKQEPVLRKTMRSDEIIDVNIKGIDDGIKTSRQQDYQEAVMNAKLQAIERAGASIEAITQVVNFQLKYDAVESKSKAMLMPGFQIIDIGYVADGTYQIVLAGRIQTDRQEAPNREIVKKTARETARDGRFIAYDNGTVLDTRTGLMWAAQDNGANINWKGAKIYCANYRGGGYTDWRMPTQHELAGLYDEAENYKADCGPAVHLTELIHLTCNVPWASDSDGTVAGGFRFGGGLRGGLRLSFDFSGRALPVRAGK